MKISSKLFATTGALVGALMLAQPAAAATITFDFTTGSTTNYGTAGNSFSSGGVTVNATAWGLTGGSSDNKFAKGYLTKWSGNGLGDCNASEGSGCDSPNHQVDNSGHYDFILFQFTSGGPLDPTSVGIKNFALTDGSNDIDATYWVGTGALPLDLTNKTVADLAGLGFGAATTVLNSGPGPVNVAIGGSTAVTSLLFAAQYPCDYQCSTDSFKIQSLTVDPTKVPEPATIALLGAGLLGAAVARRRGRQARSN